MKVKDRSLLGEGLSKKRNFFIYSLFYISFELLSLDTFMVLKLFVGMVIPMNNRMS